MYHMQHSTQIRGLGAVSFNSIYCPDVKRTCVSASVKAEARERCQAGTKWTSNKDCSVAPGETEITDLDKGHFTPCTVANDIPTCGGDDGEFVDEKTMYIVGGILGVIVLGGVGYAVFRKKKKKGKR